MRRDLVGAEGSPVAYAARATSIDGFGGFLICEVVMRLKSLGTTKPKPNVTVHKENP